jgi:hypothetical protein
MSDPLAIPTFFDRTRSKPLIGSYTFLKAYQNCPHQMRAKYITKEVPYVETEAMKEGNAIHLAMENRLRIKQPLPPKYAQWEGFAVPFDAYGDSGSNAVAVELKAGIDKHGKPCEFFAQNVWFRGKIDAAVIRNGTAYVVDWKSGGSKYEDPFELEIGAVLLQAKFNAIKIAGQYAWLAENRLGQLYDLSDTNKTFAKMKRLMEEIERDRTRDWFEKRKSGLCGYCPCEGCEHHFVARSK